MKLDPPIPCLVMMLLVLVCEGVTSASVPVPPPKEEEKTAGFLGRCRCEERVEKERPIIDGFRAAVVHTLEIPQRVEWFAWAVLALLATPSLLGCVALIVWARQAGLANHEVHQAPASTDTD